MKIQFDNPEDLIRFTEKLIYTVGHERYWTKKWMKNFGSVNRSSMDNWQERTDTMIRDLQIVDSDLNKRIEVKIKSPETLGSEAIT